FYVVVHEQEVAGRIHVPAGRLVVLAVGEIAVDQRRRIVGHGLAILDRVGRVDDRDSLCQIRIGNHDVVGVAQWQAGGDQVDAVFGAGGADLLAVGGEF